MKAKTALKDLAGAAPVSIRRLAFGAAIALSGGVASAATIHECRAYNGSSFFSSDSCSGHNAIGVMNHHVPDGIPFEQQVKLIEAASSRKAASSQAEDSNRNRLGQCEQLDRELTALRAKYTSWKHVPIDEVNADQARERDLKSERSRLRCYSR